MKTGLLPLSEFYQEAPKTPLMTLEVDKIQRGIDGSISELIIGPGEGDVAKIRIEDGEGTEPPQVRILDSTGTELNVILNDDFRISQIIRDGELVG